MIKTTFVLKEPKSSSETIIYLVMRWDGLQMKISTKQKVNPKFWNKERLKVKETISEKNHQHINKELVEIEKVAYKMFNSFTDTFKRKPNSEELKNLIEQEYFQNNPMFKKVDKKTILDYFDDYIETIKSTTAHTTVQKYKQAKENFKDFQKDKKRICNTEMIDLKFRNEYVEYLIETKKYAPTTVYRKMKFLRTVLYFIENLGIKVNPFLHNSRFLTKDIEVDNIALSESEIDEMEKLNLSDNKRLEQVRDLFLVACYTGQRFSDLNKINQSNIIDDEYIAIRQQKTNEQLTLPLLKVVKTILVKYSYKLPKISNVKFNEYIKEVAKLCETLNKQYNGDNKKVRWQMISSHTARRTFVTLNYGKGVDLDTLKLGTGHKQTKTLQTYIKMNDKQKADLLRSKLEPKRK
ncbi:site-specific integrase [Empedobacter sp. GD03797]|uniref:site-specific integrase n=1 Tax=Empedobacter sp. GD03797 TaxID=2975382 RepID=UPI0024495779|nr:site-specific integrase [Empedobacter sp. GD03797]MDH1882119.1 site-specific integrase [Empedobacter sp. GD03797]